jgi:hypothetical protein
MDLKSDKRQHIQLELDFCQGRFEIRPKGGGKLDQFLG